MEDTMINQLEIAPQSAVLGAVTDFARALLESPQFKAFESAAEQFQADKEATEIADTFQKKQQALSGLMRLNALSKEDREELEGLRTSFLSRPSVIHYNQAQSELVILCQAVGDILSQTVGFDFPAAGRTSGGCCG